MSASTKDREKVGKTTWRVNGQLDNGDNPFADEWSGGEFESESEAIAKASAWLREPLPDGMVARWSTIQVGTYEAEEFDDEEYGLVFDATWDSTQQIDLWIDGAGTIHTERQTL